MSEPPEDDNGNEELDDGNEATAEPTDQSTLRGRAARSGRSPRRG